MSAPLTHTAEIVPIKTRLLSVVTGCFIAITGSLLMGPLFSIWPAILILGAIVQPFRCRLGRGLMLSGAVLLSPWGVFFVGAVSNGIGMLREYNDFNSVGVLSLMLVSVLLLAWCDVVLVVNEVKMRRAARLGRTTV